MAESRVLAPIKATGLTPRFRMCFIKMMLMLKRRALAESWKRDFFSILGNREGLAAIGAVGNYFYRNIQVIFNET